ncbi:MAG TPA: glycoside hydrolase family 15 protein [Mycobacteriales bacterium]|nr:glycoside hydrolase family 15 protein [Mycobacteriales bacterium]
MKPVRVGGYAPIEQYAAIGDGRSVALVAADGSIDWWPVGRMDETPTFSGLLDAQRGGVLTLCPTAAHTVSRSYLTDTNILETIFTTASGVVRVRDTLPVGHGGRLSWGQLVRQVDGIDGAVPMRWSVVPGNRFATGQPWVRRQGEAVLVSCGPDLLAVQAWDCGEPTVTDRSIDGTFTTAAGSSGVLAVSGGADQPAVIPTLDQCRDLVELTAQRWRDWSRQIRYDGPWKDAVRRSALALKLLIYSGTGAIAAAPTTSLPERIGGDKNWDYRYMWVRDTSFTIDALLTLGLQDEAHAAVQWMLGALRRTSPDLRVCYTLEGLDPPSDHAVDFDGYRGSRPVRSGNRAAGQTQLGTFGDLFDMIWQYVEDGHRLDAASARLLADLADRCCDTWMLQDAGIWELPDSQHYTVAKIGCWTALDRALQLVDAGQLESARAPRWASERERIKSWIHENCWSATKRSFTAYAGTEDLDAATLLAARTGFDVGERLAGTIAAIQDELALGPMVYRYSGAADEEGAFLACTYWLVIAMVLNGQRDAARKLMDDSVALTNDVGLLAEEIDPDSGAMLGNFPQGLSHLALINAACAYTYSD